jgi:hypothetical protein
MPSSTHCSDRSSSLSWFTHRRDSSQPLFEGTKVPLVISTRLGHQIFEIGDPTKRADKFKSSKEIPVLRKYGAQVIPDKELQTGFFDSRLVWRGLYDPLYKSKSGIFCVTISPKTYAAAMFLRLAHRTPAPSGHDHIKGYRAGASLDAISPPITMRLNQLEKLWLTDELYFGSMYDTKPFRRHEYFRRYFQANVDVLYSFRSMVFFPNARLVSCKAPRKDTELLYTVPTYDKAAVIEAFYRTQVCFIPNRMSFGRISRPSVWVEGKRLLENLTPPARPAAAHCTEAHRRQGEGIIDEDALGEELGLGNNFEKWSRHHLRPIAQEIM